MGDEFWAAYRDPKWQRRKAEILEADGWSCRYCGDQDKTLNVHHHFYIKGRKPWQYENDQLSTLCDACHEIHTALHSRLREALSRLHIRKLTRVIGYVEAANIRGRGEGAPRALQDPLNPGWMKGVADCLFGTTGDLGSCPDSGCRELSKFVDPDGVLSIASYIEAKKAKAGLG